MADVMILANGARNQRFQRFVEFFGGLLMLIRWLRGVAERSDMNCMPEKGAPDFGGYVHSNVYLRFLRRAKNRVYSISRECRECRACEIIAYAQIAVGKDIHFVNA